MQRLAVSALGAPKALSDNSPAVKIATVTIALIFSFLGNIPPLSKSSDLYNRLGWCSAIASDRHTSFQVSSLPSNPSTQMHKLLPRSRSRCRLGAVV